MQSNSTVQIRHAGRCSALSALKGCLSKAAPLIFVGAFVSLTLSLNAQDNPLDRVHVPPPAPPPVSATPAPATSVEDAAMNKAGRMRVDVNLVLIPVTVTDGLNRLVTGLDKDNFYLFEDNVQQTIRTFSSEDAPVSLGIVFDLSGSMSNKLSRAKQAIAELLHTANPQDEFFVVGFNDRPELVEDFTNSPDDTEARLMSLRSGHRTALLDAIYFGLNKMKQAKYERKSIIIVSDGGDNRSRYTVRELLATVQESDVQIYAVGIFDQFAATDEEREGPALLDRICDQTGGRLFRISDVGDMGDIATKIGSELRNQYVLGYRSSDKKRDGRWRKVKVRLAPPPGLPTLSLHFRTGYYAPSQ
jgi:Ca-activated chloride channel family protein